MFVEQPDSERVEESKDLVIWVILEGHDAVIVASLRSVIIERTRS